MGPQAVSFMVWAPGKKSVSAKIISHSGTLDFPLKKDEKGYFRGVAEGTGAGDRYLYVLDRSDSLPDPASRYQPDGVHLPSQIVDPREFPWTDEGWKGLSRQDLIVYELHVGTFSKEGTFQAVIPRLDYLRDLGITAVELMPVAQFPGSRNWGYDGVYPFAPQDSYGGPQGLKELINAAHNKGLAVVLDVVYNHLGPEGNYLGRYAPYFTDRYKTPWGDAVNFDGPYSDEVRRFFLDNACYWICEYHIDALRLDAVHGIFDFNAVHFLEELGDAIRRLANLLGRKVSVIAESDLNDARIIKPGKTGGYGLDAQWNDDFHHALHVLITKENKGYYEDFGRVEHLQKAFKEGFVYTGQYSRYRKRRHGNSSRGRSADQFIVFSQSHDQVGNRMVGDRLSMNQSIEKLKLCAGVVILSPFIPLLFMGEEYGETAPFLYFISHSDPALVDAIREGRRKEFSSFRWEGELPDPQDRTTFLASKLTGNHGGKGKFLYGFYRELIRIRKELPVLHRAGKQAMETRCFEDEKALLVRRWDKQEQVFILYNFGDDFFSSAFTVPDGRWEKILESSSREWGGGGVPSPGMTDPYNSKVRLAIAPHSFVLYRTLSGFQNRDQKT